MKTTKKGRFWSRPSIWIGSFAAIVIIVIFGLFWWGIDHWITDPNLRGVFGDKFGAINALFSGFAFLGLIITLIFQQEELKLQRTELEQTRDELINQRKEFEVQNKTLKYQQFESTLFSMMSLQQQIVSDLYYDSSVDLYGRMIMKNHDSPTIIVRGRDLFRFSFVKQHHKYRLKEDTEYRTALGFKECLSKVGLSIYVTNPAASIYDHYFRHLYRIIKFIDTSTLLTREEKYQAIGNVRGTMSRYELVWLYYNILANRFLKFKGLIERYAFFKNLDPSSLALCAENRQLIPDYDERSMFGKMNMTDFYFFMTESKEDDGKYYLGAFFNETNEPELRSGLLRLNEWRTKYLDNDQEESN